MSTYVGAPSKGLHYSFPILASIFTTRDASMVNNLKFEGVPQPTKPSYLNKPISKHFGDSLRLGKTDPLKSILTESQKILAKYEVKSYSKSKQQAPTTPQKPQSPSPEPNSIGRGVKRNRADIIPQPITMKTPLRNKLDLSSPSPKRISSPLVQTTRKSTPVAFKPTSLCKQRLMNRAPEPKGSKKQALKLELDGGDDSDYDNLACHADNILRMAVDSTMLGSFYNNSFSFSFSNIVNEDSFLGERKRDENGAGVGNESLLELKKSILNKLKATKIEINDDDLRRAIDGV